MIGAGADAGMDDVVRRHQADVVRSMALVCGSVQEAEDAVQDALLAYWTTNEGGLVIESPRAWLITASMNRLRSGWRRRALHSRYLEGVAGAPNDSTSDSAMADVIAVREAMSHLPFRQRQAAVLFYLLDMSIGEAAAVMNVSPGMVKNALFRARTAMAERLNDLHEGEARE